MVIIFVLVSVEFISHYTSVHASPEKERKKVMTSKSAVSLFPWPEEKIAHYTAYRVDESIKIDGRLDELCWLRAPRSPRFVDMITGKRAIHDTRAAVLWDEKNLYVGFWIEEPHVTANLTERDSLIYTNNDVEVFIAGKDAYYEFEINALNTIYEVFFIWEEAYERSGYSKLPEFQRNVPQAQPFNGVGFANHPRGGRLGFFGWDFPGIQTAVQVDGTLNDESDRDRGWTVELAFPWAGMKPLTLGDHRSIPPKDGDIWRMDFSRFNQYKEAPPANDSGGWTWSAHGAWDSHIPECFPFIHFSSQLVKAAVARDHNP
jgi:hypothetical protein